jgi:hypothetical protein
MTLISKGFFDCQGQLIELSLKCDHFLFIHTCTKQHAEIYIAITLTNGQVEE